jgi:predicted permease
MNLRDLKLRLRALLAPRHVERELDEELSFHIERETRRLIDEGMSPEEARLKAQARFGSITAAADECRDERGIAPVETTVRDIGYAMRTFVRAPLASLTIVVTVAIGLGLVAVLFSLLNMLLFRVDQVPDINEMFAVERPRLASDERQLLLRADFEALRRDTQVFSGVYAELQEIDTRIDGRMMAGALVSGNFFQVLGRQAILGRTLLPSDDERGGERVLVLSDRGWTRKFDRDPDIIGRSVIVNGAPHTIIGVMPAGFRGLEVSAPVYWAPIAMLAEHLPSQRGRDGLIGLGVVGRLRPGISMQSARAQLDAWDAQRTGVTADRRAVAIELLPKRGTVPQPMEALIVFTPLFFVFGLVLLIGCANVANLLLARALTRQKEIGIRLSIGASRGRIVRQLLTESLLLALAASALGFVIGRAALNAAIGAFLRAMPQDLGDVNLLIPDGDWRVGVFLVVSAVVATALFALLPALHATRIDPVRTLRGEMVKDAKPGRSRNILIGLQVAASALLLICSAVFLRSSFASATYDPGFRTRDIILVDVINEPKREVMVQAVAGDASVSATAATWPNMLSFPRGVSLLSAGNKVWAGYRMVAPAYFAVLDIPIVRGRAFTAVEGTDQLPVAIVNEDVAKALWPNADAIGQTITIDTTLITPTQRIEEPPLKSRTVTVVGVSRNVPGFRITDVKEASVYLPVHAGVAKTSLVARVHGDVDQVRRALLDRLTLIDPNMGQVLTMRSVARLETFFLRAAFWVTLVLGGLALSLTVSGLFSVLSYLVEQRAKEIGLRIALGATSQNVTRLILAQTSRPVIAGLAAGTGLALALATALLSTPAAGLIGAVIHVRDPLAYATSLMLIVAACLGAAAIPAARASRVDPMQTLRQD